MDHFARLGLPAALDLEPAVARQGLFRAPAAMASRSLRRSTTGRARQGLDRGCGAERRLSDAEGSALPRRLLRRAEGRGAAGRRQDDRRPGPPDGSHGGARGAARGGERRGRRRAGGAGDEADMQAALAGARQFVLAGRQARHQKGAPSPALPRQVRRGGAGAAHQSRTSRRHEFAGDPRAGRNAPAACRRGLARRRHRSRHDQFRGRDRARRHAGGAARRDRQGAGAVGRGLSRSRRRAGGRRRAPADGARSRAMSWPRSSA